VPLAAFVEAVLRALWAVYGPGAHRLDALEVGRPLFLPDGEPQELELTLQPRGRDAVAVVVRARDADAGNAFVEIASGSATRGAPDGDALAVAHGEEGHADGLKAVRSARARCPDEIPLAALFDGLRARGIEYGPAYRGLQQAWRAPGEVIARVEPGRDALDPTTLDLAVQAVAMAAADEAGEALWFPTAVSSCAARAGEVAWVWARAQKRGDRLVGEAQLRDDDGRVLARLADLQLGRATAAELERARDATIGSWVHEVAWRALAETAQPADAAIAARLAGARWLVVSDGGEVGAAARRALLQAGAAVALAFPGASFRELEPGLYELPLDDEAASRRLLVRAAEALGGALSGVLYLGGLRAHTDDRGPKAAADACSEALKLARAILATCAGAVVAQLVIVTRGAQPLDARAPLLPFQSALWGAGRTLALEHPELRCALVDLDPAALSHLGGDLVRALVMEDESQLALRDGTAYAARLVPLDRDGRERLLRAPALALLPQATYLVTGGLGGLGLQAAEWLVARGARHLAILSRQAPAPASATRLAALRGRGAEVRAYACDVADAASLA
jgi:myxalamid-type polyketide synthase MxaE and MxaD